MPFMECLVSRGYAGFFICLSQQTYSLVNVHEDLIDCVKEHARRLPRCGGSSPHQPGAARYDMLSVYQCTHEHEGR